MSDYAKDKADDRRDMLAMAAMHAMLSQEAVVNELAKMLKPDTTPGDEPQLSTILADAAYDVADAMIKRSKK